MKVAVNHGILMTIDGMDVEVLSHTFHNPLCDIVCTYYMDGDKMCCVTYGRYTKTNKDFSEIYKYRKGSMQHYYSREYRGCKGLPAQYTNIVNKLKEVHKKIKFQELVKRGR